MMSMTRAEKAEGEWARKQRQEPLAGVQHWRHSVDLQDMHVEVQSGPSVPAMVTVLMTMHNP